MMKDATPQLFASGLAFPEGPCFDREGNLFVVNCRSGDISRISPDGRVSCFANTGGSPNGAAFAADGNLYICEAGLGQLLVVHPDATWEVFVDRCDGQPLRSPNDLVFDQFGNLYFTDPGGSNPDNPIGTVHFVTPSGEITKIDEGMQFPNGIALSGDGRTLVVVETYPRCVWQYDVVRPGVVTNKRMLWQSDDERNLPDGMAYDEQGNLYLASFGTGLIDVISPQGETVRQYEAGGLRPTNVAFGGPDFSTIYITECETDCVYTLDVGMKGLRLFPDQAMEDDC